tara:strand:- start:93 stop:272 length:180 start_codon:yes stop_codon:yes gene_type:complete
MKSPCTRHCSINEKQICVGCGRTRGEITGWRNMTEEEQQETVIRAKDRCSNNNNNNKGG